MDYEYWKPRYWLMDISIGVFQILFVLFVVTTTFFNVPIICLDVGIRKHNDRNRTA